MTCTMTWFPFLSRDARQSPYRTRRSGPRGTIIFLYNTIYTAVSRLQTSFDPNVTLTRLKAHQWSYKDLVYVMHFALWTFWITVMREPPFPYKLGIPILYLIAISELSVIAERRTGAHFSCALSTSHHIPIVCNMMRGLSCVVY